MTGNILRAIVMKELREGVRDQRAVLSAFSFPLFAPLLIAFMLYSLATRQAESVEIAVSGLEHAPSLADFLEYQGVELVDAPDDPEEAILTGELDVALIVSEDYPEDFRRGVPARVQMLFDESRDASRPGITIARRLLEAYSGQLGAMRLLARGVDPRLVSPILIDERDLANPQKRAASLLDMIVMFVVLGAFVCSMYIAIEAAAGERERRSLEPLLINPVSRTILVLGKWLAAVVFGVFGIVLTLLVLVSVMRLIPLETLGFRIVLDAAVAAQIFLIAIPLAPFAGALQLLIASFTRSFKEAQLYISLSLTFPMLPGMLLTFRPTKPEEWMMAVPLLSQQLMGTQLLRGEGIAPGAYLMATSGVLLLTVFCLWLTVRLFKTESIVFGR